MLAAQAEYSTNASEEVANDTQYNASVAQFATGHAATQGSITNLTANNVTQQQPISALQL